MSGTDQKRIADGLYLLAAGANPETFMRVIRAYLLQHIETTEQMFELLCDLSSVNPHAFVAGVQALAGRPLPQAPKPREAMAMFERLHAEITANAAAITAKQSTTKRVVDTSPKPKAKKPAKRPRAHH